MQSRSILLMSFNLLIGVVLGGCAGFAGPPGGGIPLCPNSPVSCPDLTPVVVLNQADLDANVPCILCNFEQVNEGGGEALKISVMNRGGIGFHKDRPLGVGATLGNPNAPASITRVVISAQSHPDTVIDLSTPELKVGFSVTLEQVVTPPHCANTECHITVMVDAGENITESKEGNNRFSCRRTIIH